MVAACLGARSWFGRMARRTRERHPMVGMMRRLRLQSRRKAWLATVAAGLLLAGCTAGPAEEAKPDKAALEDAQLKAAQQAEATYNYADAVNIYQGLHSAKPQDPQIALSLAKNLRFAGQPQNAISVINQLIGVQ